MPMPVWPPNGESDIFAAPGAPPERSSAEPPEPDPPPAPAPATDERPEYEVVGENHIVFNTLPGDRFRRRIPPAQEARLTKAGHIKRITPKED